MSPDTAIDIFSYANYRDLLRDLIDHKKKSPSGFSFRMFAKYAGFSSPSYLKLVLDEQRNLSKTSIDKLNLFFKLKGVEAEFFHALVAYNQAENSNEKEVHWKKLEKMVHISTISRMQTSKGEYFSKWHHVIVREMIQLNVFSEDPKILFQLLKEQVELQDIERSLTLIESLGLAERCKDGKLKQKDVTVWWNHSWENLYIKIYYRQVIEQALKAMDNCPVHERYFGSMTFAFSKQNLMRVKEKIKAFQEDLIAFTDQDKTSKDEVYQLNLQLFPMLNSDKS